MIRKIILALMLISSLNANCQSADALNEKAKELIAANQISEAFVLIKQAAEKGNPEAQYNLGYGYQTGNGVEQNIEKAMEWYAKAAAQDYTDALFQMMMACGNGVGVEQDMTKAFDYALKCADNDDPTCMFNVINCYRKGTVVEKSTPDIIAWTTRLALMENTKNKANSGYITSARLDLATMYAEGIDVDQNPATSYMWYLIYNERKADIEMTQQELIIQKIKTLESSLSIEQKNSARSEAEKLLGRPLKNTAKLHTSEM